MSGNKQVYNDISWASEIESYKSEDFQNENVTRPCLLKALLVSVEWSNEDRELSSKDSNKQVFKLVTHKARL